MRSRPYSYLFEIQYLGLRYHGWQVQKGLKTIQGTLERVFRYVLGHEDFTVLGSSRTDSGVSCLKGAFALFLREELIVPDFIQTANENLPSDIRLVQGKPVSRDFNIIQDVIAKRYGYYFAIGEKPHPFHSVALAYAGKNPDIELMRKAAALFIGKHDFRRFCTQGKQIEDYTREIHTSEIVSISSNEGFWHGENTYVFRVRGDGFLMHQVRRMAAALFLVGKGEVSLNDIVRALTEKEAQPFCPKAPAQGLVLEEVVFAG